MSTSSSVVSSSEISNLKSPVSARKRAANRANAKKSTGPKSPTGKATVSHNATTHGLHCQHLVLPCESKEAFHRFRTSYLVDLHPKTTTELLLVDRIVSASWKLRRLQAAEFHLHMCEASEIYDNLKDSQEAYQQTKAERDDYVQTYGEEDAPKLPDPPPDLDENTPPAPGMTLARLLSKNDDRSLDRLHQHEQRLERSIHRSLKELRDLRKSRPESSDFPDHPFLDDQTYNTLHPTSPRESQNVQFKPTEDESPTPTSPPSGVVASATTQPTPTQNREIKPTDPSSSFNPSHPSVAPPNPIPCPDTYLLAENARPHHVQSQPLQPSKLATL
jgi:hypothetical protein